MDAVNGRKRVLFISNIPAPYRIDFFDALGEVFDLTVLFEARRATGIRFNWNDDGTHNFHAIFLSEGEIDETHVDRRIFHYIKRGAYDHIVATSYGYYTETAALIAMRLRGIPYDLELDGGVVRTGEPAPKRFLKSYIIRGAKRLFSTGMATDALFLHYGAKRERLVRYPFTSLFQRDLCTHVPDAAEKQVMRDRLGIPYKKVVLSIGQFIPRKGFDVLLRACDRFDEDTGVYVIGGEPTAEYLSIIAEKQLRHVRFLPFMDASALAEWFGAADVFVLPTREDMWGLVINEAMAHALPVVTTVRCNAGAALVTPGENGYLVETEDAGALADCTERILADGALRERMAAASLQRMQAYTIEAMVQAHVQAFAGECR